MCRCGAAKQHIVDETPASAPKPAVCSQEATVAELKTRVETAPPTEIEKTEILQPEQTQEVAPKPEPAPVPEISRDPAPEQATEPPAAQTTIEPPSGNMVYVEGLSISKPLIQRSLTGRMRPFRKPHRLHPAWYGAVWTGTSQFQSTA